MSGLSQGTILARHGCVFSREADPNRPLTFDFGSAAPARAQHSRAFPATFAWKRTCLHCSASRALDSDYLLRQFEEKAVLV